MIKKIIYYLVGFASVLLVFDYEAFGQKLEREKDLREACRKKVAGLYFSYLDKVEQSSKYRTYLEDRLKKQELLIKEWEKKIKILEKEKSQSHFDSKVLRDYHQVEARLKNMREVRRSTELLEIKEKKQSIIYKKIFQEYEGKIRKVFEVKKSASKGAGYTHVIRYQQSCPKYIYPCPLEKSYIDEMVKYPEDSLLACKRYAQSVKPLP